VDALEPGEACFLWDDLRIPHERHKQLFGKTLTIIRIHVDLNSLTFCLPEQALADLLKELEDFTSWSKTKHGALWSLRRVAMTSWMDELGIQHLSSPLSSPEPIVSQNRREGPAFG